MQQMEIDSIRVSLLNYQRVVILKQKDADRYLPIWIGQPEADAITVKLHEVAVPRPLTHDLFQSMLNELGARIEHIIVSGLDHDTFFAKIMVAVNGRSVAIDSRPSDALALAVRAKVPIYVEEAVLEKAGVQLDKDTGGAVVGQESSTWVSGVKGVPHREATKPPNLEELQKLSAFSEFIESLDLGDLGDEKKKREK
ncbi:MAG: bifunctional nuclease family protein [Dehalococcoidia bacterium]|nr:bifunctional nuclease family protein [Dehalococcoidia bacterium]